MLKYDYLIQVDGAIVMIELFILMIERLGLIILIAYVLIQTDLFKRILFNRKTWKTQVLLIVIFSFFAILSNVNGVEVQNSQVIYKGLFDGLSPESSLANTRALTIGISGLIGGPIVGTVVGIISSIYRYMQGGLDPFVYVVSSIIIGVVSGLFGLRYLNRNRLPEPSVGALIASLFELLQMAMILIVSSDFNQALPLVQFIILPMTIINSMGMAIFLSFLHSIRNQQVYDRAIQTHDVLLLANATLPHFRKGLNIDSCTQAAHEIMNYMQVAAVSITDRDTILAHVGTASDHHKPDRPIGTELSKSAITQEQVVIARSREEIACHHPDCQLHAAIVVPLITKKEVAGTLKLYFEDENDLTFVEKNIAQGLGNIFSSQIDLGRSELEAKLLQDAEIKSLQAQVNPHFFFNAINTISALIRIDSEKARYLLIKLSDFFRANLAGNRSSLISLEKELDYVEAYLTLEQSRFPERYDVQFEIDPKLRKIMIPPFTLQVLIENAIKHAFRNRKSGNQIDVSVTELDDRILFKIIDNGFGIDVENIKDLGIREIRSKTSNGTGSALVNLNKRLYHLFDANSLLQINSTDSGTSVQFNIPKQLKEG